MMSFIKPTGVCVCVCTCVCFCLCVCVFVWVCVCVCVCLWYSDSDWSPQVLVSHTHTLKQKHTYTHTHTGPTLDGNKCWCDTETYETTASMMSFIKPTGVCVCVCVFVWVCVCVCLWYSDSDWSPQVLVSHTHTHSNKNTRTHTHTHTGPTLDRNKCCDIAEAYRNDATANACLKAVQLNIRLCDFCFGRAVCIHTHTITHMYTHTLKRCWWLAAVVWRGRGVRSQLIINTTSRTIHPETPDDDDDDLPPAETQTSVDQCVWGQIISDIKSISVQAFHLLSSSNINRKHWFTLNLLHPHHHHHHTLTL